MFVAKILILVICVILYKVNANETHNNSTASITGSSKPRGPSSQIGDNGKPGCDCNKTECPCSDGMEACCRGGFCCGGDFPICCSTVCCSAENPICCDGNKCCPKD